MRVVIGPTPMVSMTLSRLIRPGTGKTNYPLRESYATQVCRKTKWGPLARAHIELWLLKLLRLVGLQLATPHP